MENVSFGVSYKMKGSGLLYSSCVLALLLCSTGCSFEDGTVLSFIKRVTKIGFPAHTTVVAEYDQGEFEAMGKYRLPAETIAPFAASHPFERVPTEYRRLSDVNLFCRSNLFPGSDSIPPPDKRPLYYFTGCKGSNAWVFILDEKSGELWVEIQYPDQGGLGPACPL